MGVAAAGFSGGACCNDAATCAGGRAVIENDETVGASGGQYAGPRTADWHTATDEVERELVMMFRRARSLSTELATRVHPDLDPASYSLMLLVAEAGPLRGMDLADRTRLDKSTISRQLATLVRLDLLEKAPDPDDGRARRVQLSELGARLLAEARAARRQQLRGQFVQWSTEDLVEFARLLGKLNSSTP